MRAVNLIPGDGALAASPRIGRSSGAAYLVLTALAGLVVLVALWSLADRDLKHDRAQLGSVRTELAAAQAQAAKVEAFGSYQQLRAQRVANVRALVTARFDWPLALDSLARLMPSDVHLTALSGAIAGAQTAGSGATPTNSTSMTLSGCAPSQAAVARLMPRLRAVPGVADVTLTSSTRSGSGTGTGSSSGTSSSSGACSFNFVIGLVYATAPITTPAPTGTAG